MKNKKEAVEKFIKNFQAMYSLDTVNSMDYELAIGQSGKGSVFGSVFITAVWWPSTIKNLIEKLKLDENSVLYIEKSHQKALRQQIFELIQLLKDKCLFYKTIQLTARQISESMNNMMIHYNLSELIDRAVDKICLIPFENGLNVTHIFSKCFGQKEKEESRIRLNLHEYSKMVQSVKVESKNDGTYSLTNMANLIARALNQKKLSEWKFKEQTYFDQKFGSGGTSDPVTIKWLQENKHHVFGFPDLVRFSWSTVPRCLEGNLVMTVKQDEEYQRSLKTKIMINNRHKTAEKDLWDLPVLNKR